MESIEGSSATTKIEILPMKKNNFAIALIFVTVFKTTLLFSASITVIQLSGNINPGTADYVTESINTAESSGSPYLILELDSAGGLLSSTRTIVQKILNSKIPVVVYVGPKGASATSTGAVVALASEVIAMASGTHIGSAGPIMSSAERSDSVNATKRINEIIALTEGLARATGRSTQWAAKIVQDNAPISAGDALKSKAIGLMAENRAELITKLASWTWKKKSPSQADLKRGDQRVQILKPNLKQYLLGFFSDSTFAFLALFLAGLFLCVELTYPGLVFPGVFAGVAGLLSLVSFQLVPISFGAADLVVLGMALVFGELFFPTFGVLGIFGVGCFIYGSLFLVDSQSGATGLSLSLILTIAGCLCAIALVLGLMIWRRKKMLTALPEN